MKRIWTAVVVVVLAGCGADGRWNWPHDCGDMNDPEIKVLEDMGGGQYTWTGKDLPKGVDEMVAEVWEEQEVGYSTSTADGTYDQVLVAPATRTPGGTPYARCAGEELLELVVYE